MKNISSILKDTGYLLSNEMNNFIKYLDKILIYKENLKFKHFAFIFFTLGFLFLFFSIIYGLKLRSYSPIFEDDFHILSLRFEDLYFIINSSRPVGYFITALTNSFPISLIYIFYFLLIIVNLSLCFFIISFFFKIKKNNFYLYVIISSIISCTFYEYFISLKHIRAAGIFSSLFFYLNVIILFQVFKLTNKTDILFGIGLNTFLFGLSIFSKEDFFLPNLLIFFIFIFFSWKKNDQQRLCLLIISITIVTLFWIFINYKIYQNPFIFDGGGVDNNYEKKINLISILFSYGVYLLYFKPTSFYIIFFILLLISLRKKTNAIRNSLVFFILIILIIFPFSLLYKKFISEYIMQWFPIVSGLIAFFITILINQKKINKLSNILLLALFIIIFSYSSIITNSKIIILNNKLIKSNNYISAIKNNLDLIKKYNIVKINLDGDGDIPNPWYRQTGFWFKREFNLYNKWYVFTDRNSKLFKVKDDFHYDEIKHQSSIKILLKSDINLYQGLTMNFNDQGKLINLVE